MYIAIISAGLWHLQKDPGTLLSLVIVKEGNMKPQLWAPQNHSPLEAPAAQTMPIRRYH